MPLNPEIRRFLRERVGTSEESLDRLEDYRLGNFADMGGDGPRTGAEIQMLIHYYPFFTPSQKVDALKLLISMMSAEILFMRTSGQYKDDEEVMTFTIDVKRLFISLKPDVSSIKNDIVDAYGFDEQTQGEIITALTLDAVDEKYKDNLYAEMSRYLTILRRHGVVNLAQGARLITEVDSSGMGSVRCDTGNYTRER